MSSSEQMEYITSNPDLFGGDDGARFLEAVQKNDIKAIQQFLSNNKKLKEETQQELAQIEIDLNLERLKTEDKQNKAHIKWLEERKKQLEDTTNFFRADFQMLLDQEKAQLDIYKDFLEKQQEALTESLEKRKSAYEDYFDAIGEQEQDAEYTDKAETLMSNISKLITSTDMASQKQVKELQQQLDDLEKERQQTLRERARDALMESIEKQVEDISNKLGDLLEDSNFLLKTLQGEISSNPQIWTELMASAREDGMTDLQ
jgi:chromosome segregation ATPase